MRSLQPTSRLILALAGVIGLTLLVTARRLEPDPRGFGTHEQLGLTPCYFLTSTGYVCPACGCTTAWAHLLRGDLSASAFANLSGMLLGVAAVIGAPWLLITAMLGRWPLVRPTARLVLVLASAWLVVAVLDWLRRIYT